MMRSKNGIKVDNRGNGENWRNVLAAALAGLSALGVVVWWALTTQIYQQQHNIEKLSDRVNAEFALIVETKRIDDKVIALTTRIQRMTDQVNKNNEQMHLLFVTKETYTARHEALADEVRRVADGVNDDIKRTNDRLNDLRADFSKIYTPTDTIKELLERVRSLERGTRIPLKDEVRP